MEKINLHKKGIYLNSTITVILSEGKIQFKCNMIDLSINTCKKQNQ